MVLVNRITGTGNNASAECGR